MLLYLKYSCSEIVFKIFISILIHKYHDYLKDYFHHKMPTLVLCSRNDLDFFFFFLENALKKKLLNIFSNFFFYLKVQSFRLIIQNNFIEMAAPAGHAVAYTIAQIFKHIIDCCAAVFQQWLHEYCPLKSQLSLACRRNTYL